MPKGFKPTAEKHWSFDLGNYESINVSWQPHGASDLKKAESLSKILAEAETVKSAKTLDSGYHEIERGAGGLDTLRDRSPACCEGTASGRRPLGDDGHAVGSHRGRRRGASLVRRRA
jgi:hypothetical protein